MSEPVLIWIIGGIAAICLGAVVILLKWLHAHEQTCAERWERLMVEHGRLLERSESQRREP